MQVEARRLADGAVDRKSFDLVRAIYHRSRQVDEAVARAEQLDFDAVREAVEDLITTFGSEYPNGQKYLEQLKRIENQITVATQSYRKQQETADSMMEPDEHHAAAEPEITTVPHAAHLEAGTEDTSGSLDGPPKILRPLENALHPTRRQPLGRAGCQTEPAHELR